MSDLSRHFLVCKFGSHVFIFFHLFFFLPLFLTQNASARLVRALLKNLSQVGYHILVSTSKNLKNDFRKRMSACFSFLVFRFFFINITLVGTENDLVSQMAQVDDFCSCSLALTPLRPSVRHFAHEMNFNLFYFDPHVHTFSSVRYR